MSYTRTAEAEHAPSCAARCLQAENMDEHRTATDEERILTSCILGSSSNSEKMKTLGAEVASWISFAAAAPFTLLPMSKKGSSLAVKLDSSMA